MDSGTKLGRTWASNHYQSSHANRLWDPPKKGNPAETTTKKAQKSIFDEIR